MINFREPSLCDLLSDPIIDILMARDGVRRETLLALLASVARRRASLAPCQSFEELAELV